MTNKKKRARNTRLALLCYTPTLKKKKRKEKKRKAIAKRLEKTSRRRFDVFWDVNC